MSEPTSRRELGAFVTAEAVRPIVVALAGTDVVVLERTAAGAIAVWQDGTILPYPAATPAVEVTDAERWQVVVRRALLNLNHMRVRAIAERELRQTQHRVMLDGIRTYVIAKHRAGAFGQSELNEFLVEFGLKRYSQSPELTFVITGSFEVASNDRQATGALALEAVTLGGADLVAGLDKSSIRWQTEILDVVATDQVPPRTRVSYRLAGSAVVTSNPEWTNAAAQVQLWPDLAHVPGLVPESASHELAAEVQPAE